MRKKSRAFPIGAIYIRSDDLYALLIRVVRSAEGEDPESFRLIHEYADSLPLSLRWQLADAVLAKEGLSPRWREWARCIKEER